MTIIKTYKFKLRPTKSQANVFEQWLGTCRFLYNIGKELKDWAYKSYQTNLSYYDLAKQLTQAKKLEGFEWISKTPIGTLQASLEQLQRSYDNFFNGLKKGKNVGFPKYAKKYKFNSCVVKFNTNHKDQRVTHNRIRLPKVGSVKYYASRKIEGKVKRATIIKENNSWYINVICEVEHESIPAIENQEVGLDWGIAKFYSLSNGDSIDNPRFYQNNKKEIKRLQRSLSRKTKGSHNYKNVKKQLNRLHSRIARSRKDWQHNLSTNLVRRYSGIYIEKLNIKGMSKRAKPKLSEDGKTHLPNKAKAKSGLNREMLDTAPYQFSEILEYKCKWNERNFVKCNPVNSSRECSECGHVSKENRVTQSEFKCVACGHEENADTNAGKNIKSRGITTLLKQLQVSSKEKKRA